jgi:exodeoxyribonuclease-5
MISEHLSGVITGKLPEKPTSGQKKLIELLSEFVLNNNFDEIFLLTGYAGTGKTSIVAALVKALDEFKFKTILLAPTGRAAKVLSSFTGKPAFTIHKSIYRQRTTKDGFGKFVLGKNLTPDVLFIADEASMIGNQSVESSMFGSGNLFEDLLEYVYSGHRCKLILVGDTAQLPPVNIPESQILSPETLKLTGFSVSSYCLTEVVRQTEKSGILYNATIIRQLIISNKPAIPTFNIDAFPDIEKISGEELIDAINYSYDKYGIEETVILNRSNKRALMYNKGIRNSILFREEKIAPGDYLMIIKNNYFWLNNNEEEFNFLANGDTVQVVRLGKYEERYGYHYVTAKLRLIDLEDREIEAVINLESLEIEGAALSQESNKKLFYDIYEDYSHITPKRAGYEQVKNNKYFNALQVKFSYAVTCHKAQGGQWRSVFIDQGYFTNEMLNIEYLKWLYTAFTRATEKVYLVNFNKSFF